jgi:hypothetical protein
LDSAQEVRIAAVHRGFLYQHLYAAACLLNAAPLVATVVVVERDEDIEIVTSTARIYIQVKTRAHPIMPSDIAQALERFERLRTAPSARLRRRPACRWRAMSPQDPPDRAGDGKQKAYTP